MEPGRIAFYLLILIAVVGPLLGIGLRLRRSLFKSSSSQEPAPPPQAAGEEKMSGGEEAPQHLHDIGEALMVTDDQFPISQLNPPSLSTKGMGV